MGKREIFKSFPGSHRGGGGGAYSSLQNPSWRRAVLRARLVLGRKPYYRTVAKLLATCVRRHLTLRYRLNDLNYFFLATDLFS